MFFIAVCDHCGAKFRGNEQLSGKRVKCPSCGKSFIAEVQHLADAPSLQPEQAAISQQGPAESADKPAETTYGVRCGCRAPPGQKDAGAHGKGTASVSQEMIVITLTVPRLGWTFLLTLVTVIVLRAVNFLPPTTHFFVYIGTWVLFAQLLKGQRIFLSDPQEGRVYYMQKREIACLLLLDGTWLAIRSPKKDASQALREHLRLLFGDRMTFDTASEAGRVRVAHGDSPPTEGCPSGNEIAPPASPSSPQRQNESSKGRGRTILIVGAIVAACVIFFVAGPCLFRIDWDQIAAERPLKEDPRERMTGEIVEDFRARTLTEILELAPVESLEPLPPERTATWETVSIPGLCTYQIPPTVEIQAGTYKRMSDEFRRVLWEISVSPDRVVAQPKGINEFDLAALDRYCRIIVETDRGTPGDYLALDEPLALSRAELQEFDDEVRNALEQAATRAAAMGMKMALLSWQPTRIVRMNDVDALMTTYSRSMNDAPPVLVRTYIVQNNDVMHTITVSYRESERELWADDLDAVITTFRFNP